MTSRHLAAHLFARVLISTGNYVTHPRDDVWTAVASGTKVGMKIREVIDEKIRHRSKGVNVAADVSAAIAANIGEPGSTTTSVRSSKRVVQRSRSAASATEGREER